MELGLQPLVGNLPVPVGPLYEKSSGEQSNEAHISASQQKAEEHPRLPGADGHEERPAGAFASPGPGSEEAHGQ